MEKTSQGSVTKPITSRDSAKQDTPRAAMSGDGSSARQSSVSGASSSERGTESGGLSDVLKQLADISRSQQTLMTKIDKKHKEMLTKIDQRHDGMRAEIAKVIDDVFLEVAQVTRRLETLETRVSATPLAHEPFAPDVTVIIANLPMLSQPETEAQLLEKVQDVMTNGLSLPGIEVVAVTRRAARDATPGLVLVELPCLDDKKNCSSGQNEPAIKPSLQN